MSSIFVQNTGKIYRPGIFQLFPAIQATGHVFVHYDGKFYVLHRSGQGFSASSFSPKIRESFCAI